MARKGQFVLGLAQDIPESLYLCWRRWLGRAGSGLLCCPRDLDKQWVDGSCLDLQLALSQLRKTIL